MNHSRDRLRLFCRIDDQNNWQAQSFCHVGSGAFGAIWPVKQAHHTLDDHQVLACANLSQSGLAGFGAHGPIIEIDARLARGRLVKPPIDIIRPQFCRCHFQPAVAQGANQAKCEQGFAAARLRSCNNQTFSQWDYSARQAHTNPTCRANPRRGRSPQ